MDVSNISWNDKQHTRKHNALLPRSIRGVIIGKSGCGKTTLLMNLLLKDWLDYDHLYVYAKTLHQREYQILRLGFEKGLSKDEVRNVFTLQSMFEEKRVDPIDFLTSLAVSSKNVIESEFFDAPEDVPSPSDLDPKHKNLMIFDDLMLEKQNHCEMFYTRGRHNNVDCFYISQNYFKLPRQTIRENTNFIILFPQDGQNLNHIYIDHGNDMESIEEFKKFCTFGWSKEYGFVVIDLTSKVSEGKYRHGFDTFYIPRDNSLDVKRKTEQR